MGKTRHAYGTFVQKSLGKQGVYVNIIVRWVSQETGCEDTVGKKWLKIVYLFSFGTGSADPLGSVIRK